MARTGDTDPLRRVAEAARLVSQAKVRFVSAVIAARSAGCSWRAIGTASGVPHQSLHRRFTKDTGQNSNVTPGELNGYQRRRDRGIN